MALRRKSFFAITGASRGIGRAIAVEFAANLGPGSVLAVFARNGGQLEELKQQIMTLHPQITVCAVSSDLGAQTQEWYDTIFPNILAGTSATGVADFEQAILINNAASVLFPKLAAEHTDKTCLDHYFHLNLSSPIMLTSHFLNLFTAQTTRRRYVVNISSGCSTMAATYLACYCTGKAARLMFFRVLAAEYPDVRVLSYDPGACDTDMQAEYRTTLPDPAMRKILLENYEVGKLLTPEASAGFLKELLEKDTFVSGDERAPSQL